MFVTILGDNTVKMYFDEKYIPRDVQFFEVISIPDKPENKSKYKLIGSLDKHKIWWEPAEEPVPEQSTEDLLLELAADYEARLCTIELGV